jgi:hypothetical protein
MPLTSEQTSLIKKARDSNFGDSEIKLLEEAFARKNGDKPTFRDKVELGITSVLGAIFVLSLFYVLTQIGQKPLVYTVGSDHHVVDSFQQALSAIALVTPFLTTIIGFWFGKTSGSDSAKKETERADKAVKDKESAETEKASSNGKLKNIEGMVTTIKAYNEQKLKNEAAEKAKIIAKENDITIIGNQLLGTKWENKVDTNYLSRETDVSEIENYLSSRGKEESLAMLENIEKVLSS